MLSCSETSKVPEEELSESNIARILAMESKAVGIFLTLPESLEYSYVEYTNSFLV